MTKKKKCKGCGKMFSPKSADQKYHNRQCYLTSSGPTLAAKRSHAMAKDFAYVEYEKVAWQVLEMLKEDSSLERYFGRMGERERKELVIQIGRTIADQIVSQTEKKIN